MVWISFILLSFSVLAKELPRFLTKHSIDSIRFISLDGRYAYVQKRPGVLGLITGFRSVDFISDTSKSSFLVKDSRFKDKLIIEVVPNTHQDFNLIKNHKILAVDWGKSQTQEVGVGRNPRLHLGDEWVSFYKPTERTITIHNLRTEKEFQIKLSPKTSPFFTPEVEMVSSDSVVYTDTNEKGYAALILYNLATQKSTIMYKTTQTATRLELCQHKGYLAIGEFPYDDVSRSSKIMQIKLSGTTNLAGFNTIYNSTDADLGNIVCQENSLYFIKTLTHLRKINHKQTEVVKLDLKTTQITTMTEMGSVGQIISMDERIMIPFRGDFYVLEGSSNIAEDKLKAPVNTNEELPLEL